MRYLGLLFFPYILFACALCSLYTPSATVDITFVENHKTLTSIQMQWNFSDEFIQELKRRYDTNHNNLLDPKELERIHTILDAYVSKRDYLTLVEYYPQEGGQQKILLRPLAKSYHTKEGQLSFIFTFTLNQKLQEGDELSISLEDKQGYFNFLIHSFTNELSSFPKTQTNTNNHILFIKLFSDATHTVKPLAIQSKEALPSPVQKSWIEEHLFRLQEEIKSAFDATKRENVFFAYLFLLGVSFLYGLLHAAGPGHGKALVSSYFLSSKHRYKKALLMALCIGLVHTFSAFLLTVVLHLFFDIFFKTFFDNVTYYITKASALIIIGIAVYLLTKTLKRSKNIPNIVSFSSHPQRCSCDGCSEKSGSTDFGVVLSAGIVPCPGTVTLFIFSLSSGEYLLGLFSALAMSFGMSFIIALTATGTLMARQHFLKHSLRVSTYAHYFSLMIMLFLGGILLIG